MARTTTLVVFAAALGVTACSCGESSGNAPGKVDGSMLADSSGEDAKLDVHPADSGSDAEDAAVAMDAKPDVHVPGHAWLGHSAWKPVTTFPECDVRVAESELPPWPGFSWKSCGPGCERTDVVVGPAAVFKGAQRFGSRSVLAGNEVILTLVGGVRNDGAPGIAWGMTIDARTEVPLGFVGAFKANCGMNFQGFSTNALAIRVIGAGEVAKVVHAPLKPTDSLVWASPEITHNGTLIARNSGWMELRGNAVLGESPLLASATFKTVHTASGAAYRAIPAGEAVAWVEWGTRATIGAWSQKHGGRTLVQDPTYHAAHFASGPGWLAWLGVTGPKAQTGSYETATLHWASFSGDPKTVAGENSVALPVKFSVEPMVGGSNWVAMRHATAKPPRSVLVVNLVDKSVWSILETAGNYATPLAVFDNTLLVANASAGSIQPAQYYDELIRYDLTKLSAFATKLP